MHTELKKEIINSIFENIDDFQLTNFIINKFRDYIYDRNGNCLIGGEDILEFIENIIRLIKE